jgi:hypothetical protein
MGLPIRYLLQYCWLSDLDHVWWLSPAVLGPASVHLTRDLLSALTSFTPYLALYGAVLSTFSLIASYIRERPRLQVRPDRILAANYKNGETIWYFRFTIVNSGRRPATVKGVDIRILPPASEALSPVTLEGEGGFLPLDLKENQLQQFQCIFPKNAKPDRITVAVSDHRGRMLSRTFASRSILM